MNTRVGVESDYAHSSHFLFQYFGNRYNADLFCLVAVGINPCRLRFFKRTSWPAQRTRQRLPRVEWILTRFNAPFCQSMSTTGRQQRAQAFRRTSGPGFRGGQRADDAHGGVVTFFRSTGFAGAFPRCRRSRRSCRQSGTGRLESGTVRQCALCNRPVNCP